MKFIYDQLSIIFFLVVLSQTPLCATTYYVSTSGNDNNAGTSMSSPWQTLTKVSNTIFSPGDQILFNSGDIFTGQLVISTSGINGSPIIYGIYGGTAKPVIAAQGNHESAVYFFNKSYVELRGLKVTNFKGGNDINSSSGARLLGIHVVNQNGGTKDHIYLNDLEVTDVNSEQVTFSSRYYGGVLFEIVGETVKSNWNDILVSNCNFHHISRTGLNFDSSWKVRSSTSEFGNSLPNGYTDNWYPSNNIVIQDNSFEHISGNGLVVRVSTGTLVEGNFFNYCGEQISGNAAFCFNTDGMIFQFNEAQNTVYNTGDTDARGFDSDYRSKNTIVQYNYLHDNGKGGFVATGGPEDGTAYERFNKGLLFRYNILEDNRQEGLSFSGNLYDATVHNNVIFGSSTISDVEIVKFKKWSKDPHDVRFYNNIFFVKGSNAKYTYGDVRNIVFSHNLYSFTTTPQGLPVTGYNSYVHIEEDNFAVLANPMLNNPGGTDTGYKLTAGSPAFNVGKTLTQPDVDYYNNIIGSTSNIGVDQVAGESTVVYEIDIDHTSDVTKDGWTGLRGTEGSQVTISGTRFTMFGGIDGTRDRGSFGEVTRDFAFNDGPGNAVAIRLENLPPGNYDVNTWHYDADGYTGLVNVEFRQKGNSASTEVKVVNKSITNSSSTSFRITVEDDVDYELVVRENSEDEKTRFNGIRLTPVSSSTATSSTAMSTTLNEDEPTSQTMQLRIFPTPVTDKFTIVTKIQQDDRLGVTIWDLQGRKVYSSSEFAEKGHWEMNLSKKELNLKRGIYTVTILSDYHGKLSSRILIF